MPNDERMSNDQSSNVDELRKPGDGASRRQRKSDFGFHSSFVIRHYPSPSEDDVVIPRPAVKQLRASFIRISAF
jgi:hypothetical protein